MRRKQARLPLNRSWRTENPDFGLLARTQRWQVAKILYLLICLTTQCFATPKEVTIGLYVVDIFELNIKEESFLADFYFWVKWEEGDDKNFDPTRYEFMNGVIDRQQNPDERIKGKVRWQSKRIIGKFRSSLDFRDYPLDKQQLKIEIEDGYYDAAGLVYKIDPSMENEPYPISLSGWTMSGGQEYTIREHEYKTNYGNPFRDPQERSVYSRAVISIPIEHMAARHTFLKLYLPVFLAGLVAFLTFLVEPIDLDARFGVGIASIFGAVTSMIYANSIIPETPYFSLSDKIHLSSLIFIFATMVVSCFALKCYKAKGKTKTCWIDRYVGGGLLVLYFVVMGSFTLPLFC